jgi:hypothetical protein
MGQRVDVQPHYPYLLEMRVRTQDPDAELSFALCEIWLLASMRCQHASQRIAPGAGWQDFQQLLNSNTLTTPLGRLGKWAKRPVRLTFYAQNAPTGIDIDALALRGPGGNMLLRNGSFEQGHDNWFWQSDAHDHWHIDNLWVATLFEQGWLGVVMLACLWLAALYQLGHAYWLGDYLAGIVLASLIALSIASITQSMFDAPRITMAIMLLLLTALFWPKVKPAHVL